MRALITNDDGLHSAGLRTLGQAALAAGYELVAAAPAWDSSGASASITAVAEDGKVPIERHEVEGLDGVPAFALEASPAFIVRTAVEGAFGPPPDVVLAGVNDGPNTGHSVLHSGTLGAALTAVTLGRTAVAFSLDVRSGPDHHWGTAEVVTEKVLRWLAGRGGRPTALNVNVPNVVPRSVTGFARARLAPFGAVRTNVLARGEGFVQIEYRDVDERAEPGTDVALVAEGKVALTPLLAVSEDDGADLSGLAD